MYQQLEVQRQVGFGFVGPIPVSETVEFLRAMGFEGERFRFFLQAIMYVDMRAVSNYNAKEK